MRQSRPCSEPCSSCLRDASSRGGHSRWGAVSNRSRFSLMDLCVPALPSDGTVSAKWIVRDTHACRQIDDCEVGFPRRTRLYPAFSRLSKNSISS